MSVKLAQKHIYKGTREFELLDDAVNVRIDMPFLNKEFTVVLAILDPEPVVQGSSLAFVSVVNREPLLEFFVDKPDAQAFNAFVQQVRERIIEEDYGKPKSTSPAKRVNVEQLQIAIDMLRSYLGDDAAGAFLESLEALRSAPQERARLDAMYRAFDELGPAQGAVLTYAPYIGSLLSDDIPDPGPAAG